MRAARSDALILTPAFDGADGISEVSRQIVAALASHVPPPTVEVWALDGGAPVDRLASPLRFRSAGGSRARLAAWSLARAASRRPDALAVVLHVHLAPVALALSLRGARLAVFLHGVEAWQPLRVRERVVMERADVLMANSQWTADRFKDANPHFRAAEIGICHLGVPPASNTPQAPPFSGYALIVGRLAAEERYKGHEPLIRVWPRILESVPSARLMIVGDGDDRARLESLVAARRLADAVHFAGRVSSDALEGYYRDAALFVMPSTGEGFGLAYLEAMRAGKACVASPGAPREIVVDGVTGLLVDPLSPDALAAAVIRLFREPETSAAMGRAGAERVRRCFEAKHFADRVRAHLARTDAVTAW